MMEEPTPIMKVRVFIMVCVNMCGSVCPCVYAVDQMDKLSPHGYEVWREEWGDPLRSILAWFHHEIWTGRSVR